MTTSATSTSASTTLEPDIEAWLDDFDLRSAEGGSVADLFAESFLSLAPAHAFTLNPTALAAALPQRRAMFEAAGVGIIIRVDAQQLRLDPRHVLIRAAWDAPRADQTAVRLESAFLLRREPAGYRVVVYLNHHDVPALLNSKP